MTTKYKLIDQNARKAAIAEASERFPNELVDQLLAGTRGQDILGRGGLIGQLAGRLVERMLESELADHLGYKAGTQSVTPHPTGNTYNGTSAKNVS